MTNPIESGKSFDNSEKGILRERVARHLSNATPIVLMDNPKIGAIHGTSIEAMEYILDHGVLLGAPRAYLHYQANDISIYPTVQLIHSSPEANNALSPRGRDQVTNNPEISLGDTNWYAEEIAVDHAIFRTLGIPLEERGQFENPAVVLRDWDDSIYFEEHGKNLKDIADALTVAKQRKGFLLGLSLDIQSEVIFIPGDRLSSHIAIRPKENGFSYRLIEAIEPLGEIEKKFMRSLQA